MRRIKLGKGLLRSLFPSSSKNKKKKSSSNKNTSSSGGTASNNTPVNSGSSSAFNCPTVLGGSRRKNDQRPYELHQEGASSPPTSDDEGRDHDTTFGGGGVGEKELQLTPQQQQQQQHDVKQEEAVITPFTVACSSIEDQDKEGEKEACMTGSEQFAALTKDDGEDEATDDKQLKEDFEYCVPQPTQELVEDASFGSTSPSRDETRRRAIARQQRILSHASTRFQSLSDTATIDTSGLAYCSPPHLQRRRWQHHIGRQAKPQASGDDGNQQVSSQGQSIIGLPPRQKQQQQQQQQHRQQPPTNNTNCSSIVFYDSTPIRTIVTNGSNSKNNNSSSCSDVSKKEGQLPSPTCVTDMEHFGVSTPSHDNRRAANGNQVTDSNSSIGTNTTTEKKIYFFVLLLCPKSRIFEVIGVSDAPLDSTVGDVLKIIPRNITDGRLLKKKYIGLCRPADRTEFIDLASPAFLAKKEGQGEDNTPFDFIHENDVLIAILKGSTCYQMSKISKPILRNPKFKEMIRRRRRQSAADKAARKKKRKSKKKQNDKLRSPTKEIYVPDDCSVVSGITCTKPVRSRKKDIHGGEDPTSLSKMLETLSKKLHEVEEDGAFLPADGSDNSSMGSSSKQNSVVTDLDEAKRKGQEGFKMSPKMLAMELAQTIEEIFADNNVEIVAVDADDDDGEDSRVDNKDGDDDSDTFVSARSHRTQSSNATRKSAKMPRNIVASKHRTKTSPRQFKFAETMEDNALAAQIEAMAVQADAAFEDRSKKNSSRIVSRTTVAIDRRSNNASPVSNASPLSDDAAASNVSPLSDDAAVSSTAAFCAQDDSNAQDLSESFQTTIECEDVEVAAKVKKRASKDTNARTFLNATTSTVSKMVADNQGRVNEMHVLESLGCTIVCIAANYMQTKRQKEKPPSIETTDLFQSATFLAFMVSGQKYLARVTEK